MGIKADRWIVEMAHKFRMIEPFERSLISEGRISFGVSSYGYDFRVDRQFQIYQGGDLEVVDPKQVDVRLFEDFEGESCVIPAHSFALAQSVEYFRIPRNILTLCTGKSTYARCGLIVNVTPFEPEWEGHVTMSLSNTSPSPLKVYAGEGIAQLLFLESDQLCETSYKDRKGKYQAQAGIVHARIGKNEASQNDKKSP